MARVLPPILQTLCSARATGPRRAAQRCYKSKLSILVLFVDAALVEKCSFLVLRLLVGVDGGRGLLGHDVLDQELAEEEQVLQDHGCPYTLDAVHLGEVQVRPWEVKPIMKALVVVMMSMSCG